MWRRGLGILALLHCAQGAEQSQEWCNRHRPGRCHGQTHILNDASAWFEGLFVPPTTAVWIHPVDWDGDGDVDVFVWDSANVAYYEHQDNGSLVLQPDDASPMRELRTIHGCTGIEAVDWDGDGDMDLFLTRSNSDYRSPDPVYYYERRDDGLKLLEEGSPAAGLQNLPCAVDCRQCLAGFTTAASGSAAESECYLDQVGLLKAFAIFAVALAELLLLTMVLVPIKVEDIGIEDGEVMVTTVGHHFVRSSAGPVRLTGTANPMANGPFRVQAFDERRMRLLDLEGTPVTDRLDASMGFLRMSPVRALLSVGLGPVPAGLVLAVVVPVQVDLFVSWRDMHPLAIPGALGLAAATAAGIVLRRWTKLTPLARRRRDFLRRLRCKRPNPKPCPRGAGRAVRAGDLEDLLTYFNLFIRDRSMYYLVHNVILPLTKGCKLSYAELVGPQDVQWFVSHFWGSPFAVFVSSILAHASSVRGGRDFRAAAYWICSLSNNQWRVKEELGIDCDDSSFFRALRSSTCRGTCMVLDEKALPLTRSWCLFEVLQTHLLTDILGPSGRFTGLHLCTGAGVLGKRCHSVDIAISIAKKIRHVRLEDASASDPADKEMIDARVRGMDGGFVAVNSFVRGNIRESLSLVKESFEGDFREVVAAFEQPGPDPGAEQSGGHLPAATPTLLTSHSVAGSAAKAQGADALGSAG